MDDFLRRLTALEGMDMNPAAPITGEIDTSAILKQINLVKNELTFIRSDFTSYKDKTT